MKKIVLLFAIALTTLTSFANTGNEEALKNSIKIELNSQNQENDIIEFNFDSKEELIKFDINNALNNLSIDLSKDEECTASISVTVSVGVDSTFVAVTVTAEGIPCSDIVAEIKKLKAQIKDAM